MELHREGERSLSLAPASSSLLAGLSNTSTGTIVELALLSASSSLLAGLSNTSSASLALALELLLALKHYCGTSTRALKHHGCTL